MINFITSGESHGRELIGIVKGIPANLNFDENFINKELERRQIGYGRSERMRIENDKIEVLSGVSKGLTTGSPISLSIRNKGRNIPLKEVKSPRPGHGDLVGTLKYNQPGARNILERASARETAMRVAIGGICKLFLDELGIKIYSHVVKIGNLDLGYDYYDGLTLENLRLADESDFRIINREMESNLKKKIERSRENGDSLGGDIEIIVKNPPVGLGSHTNWEDKLDGKLAYSLISIQGMKSVGFGRGIDSSSMDGSDYQDEIIYKDGRYSRTSNNAGGIEAGISNGEDIVIRTSMKPIPTLRQGLKTVNINSKKVEETSYERSDVCAVASASVVCEAVVAYVLANELRLLLGGDFMEEIIARYEEYIKYLNKR